MPAVSNTSPLFNLAVIAQLHLLHEQFGEVFVPDEVLEELGPIQGQKAWNTIEAALKEGWLLPRKVKNRQTLGVLSRDLDLGEAAAIALSQELDVPTVLIDESEGRRVAVDLGRRPTGVLGVLLKAKEQGRIASVEKEMHALRDQAGFFIHADLFLRVIRLAGE